MFSNYSLVLQMLESQLEISAQNSDLIGFGLSASLQGTQQHTHTTHPSLPTPSRFSLSSISILIHQLI